MTAPTLQTPTTLQCRIYNPSDATTSFIQPEFTRVQLSAGYPGNYGVIFDGTVTLARKGRSSPTDTHIDITAIDADQAHNFSVVSQTIAAGSTPDQRLAALKKALAPYGVSDGYIPPLSGPSLPRGRVYFGMVRDHMRDLAAAVGCDWFIHGSQLNLIPQDAYAPGDAIVVTSRTGMVGLPEQTFNGVVFRCLLNPAIKPGRAIQLDNMSVQQAQLGTGYTAQAQNGLLPPLSADGFYRALLVQHSGETRGEEWLTTVTCTGLTAPVPSGLVGTVTNG